MAGGIPFLQHYANSKASTLKLGVVGGVGFAANRYFYFWLWNSIFIQLSLKFQYLQDSSFSFHAILNVRHYFTLPKIIFGYILGTDSTILYFKHRRKADYIHVF